jgi:hypothetical protein
LFFCYRVTAEVHPQGEQGEREQGEQGEKGSSEKFVGKVSFHKTFQDRENKILALVAKLDHLFFARLEQRGEEICPPLFSSNF